MKPIDQCDQYIEGQPSQCKFSSRNRLLFHSLVLLGTDDLRSTSAFSLQLPKWVDALSMIICSDELSLGCTHFESRGLQGFSAETFLPL